jgi:tRNA threonylcarbamoyladenosine biosynthesis protein TsaB
LTIKALLRAAEKAMQLKILAFDTSATACSVALLLDRKIYEIHKIIPKQQAQLILPIIDDLLKTAGISLGQLEAIAYGCGPGSFTGIRIASSVVQALGYATSLPIIPISSLAALAQTAYETYQWTSLLVASDARMKQLYWAIYQVNKHGLVDLEGQEEIGTPATLTRPAATNGYGVGDGWSSYQEELIQHLEFTPMAINCTLLPTARAILALAKRKLAVGEFVSPAEALPVYLR